MSRDMDRMVVLDFGSRHSQVTAREIRERKVYSEILPYDAKRDEILERRPKGIVLCDGPFSVLREGAPCCEPYVFHLGVPVLGIGYGFHVMCRVLGGLVPPDGKDYEVNLHIEEPGLLLQGMGSGNLKLSQAEVVSQPPPGFGVMARTEEGRICAVGDPQRSLYGVGFHPEALPEGRLLDNFLFEISGAEANWNMTAFAQEAIREIRERVKGKVVSGLSGGVDSSVATILVHKAIGDDLACIFVDHGLLRSGEADEVLRIFKGFGMRLIHVDARQRFLSRLAGVRDPETKRKIIGEEFIRVFEEEALKVGDVRYLVQGTLYPDVLESGAKVGPVIKSHHNVGGLPEDMSLDLLEPLRHLFKDEVRLLGTELGLPEEIVGRQPFPGPGLAVRIIGDITPEKLDIVRAADVVVREQIQKAGLEREVWQYFAVLLDMRTVGIRADSRAYGYTIAIRAVASRDAVTADWARLPLDVLERISSGILERVPEVNRVVYDITPKPPGTIEWE